MLPAFICVQSTNHDVVGKVEKQQQKEASPEQQAAMNRQMQKLQEFLIKAEKEGNADRPMMIKNVDGKMVMEEIPADILANFQFPEMEKEEV